MLIIIFFTILLNIVAIALTYYCLDNMQKKEKLIFIGVGIAIIYMLTSLVYWVSTKDIQIKEVSEMGKNLITFMFVPIPAILILPLLAKSYRKLKNGKLKTNKLKNRVIVLMIILVLVLIIECSYFKDIQNGVIDLIEKQKSEKNNHLIVLDANEVDMNLINSMIEDESITLINSTNNEN